MIKAPNITSLRIEKLSANYVYFKWDDVGTNFYYLVELAIVKYVDGTPIPDDDIVWNSIGLSYEPEWFDSSNISPENYYRMRFKTTRKGFEQSDWVVSDEFQTFKTNAYTYSTMKEFIPSDAFLTEKFVKDNINYVNFNSDVILAALTVEDFIYSPYFSNISSISDKILKQEAYHEIQDHIEPVCKDKDSTMLAYSNGVLYLFDRFQNMAKVSNDKGQTWFYYKALNDRVGNPVSRTCAYQNSNTMFLLGYDRIFYARSANDVRWSSDTVKFSDDKITFAKIGNQSGIDFDVDLYNTYARLPGDVSKRAEAIAANDDFCYVGAKNTVRQINLTKTKIDTDPNSPFFGERQFDDIKYKICENNNIVIKKMDVVNGILFAYVTGELKSSNLDPTISANVIPSEFSGVYMLDGDSFVRVYGNTETERGHIIHDYCNMSTNGKKLFISVYNYKYTSYRDDEETKIKYDLDYAVDSNRDSIYASDKNIHFSTLKTDSSSNYTDWVYEPQEYYAEAEYSWFAKDNIRTWITNSDKPLVVYSETRYIVNTDIAGPNSKERINREIWNKGTVTLYLNNVKFTDFSKYTNGVIFYKQTSGEIIGYYELSYRARDELNIVWKPEHIMLIANLVGQERENPYDPHINNAVLDPDLSHMITKFAPTSYLDYEMFEKFGEYYLKFISLGDNTYYNKLLNLIRNKYPREKNSVEYLWSEINKRNTYIDKNKRDAVVRFFESRSTDFYSTKGTVDTYKFLFKLLYNEDVEIEVESSNTQEYDIIVESDNISDELVGRTIYTKTGRSNVTYIEKVFSESGMRWSVVLHNLMGDFADGQIIKSEKTAFTGKVVRGISGKQYANNDIDYFNRKRSYYVMKIKSNLSTSRYRDDVLRFVHPVGFGFIGITMLTMLINSGISLRHNETFINLYRTYKFDSGVPTVYPDRVSVLDGAGNQVFDGITGEPMYVDNPRAGEPYPVPDDYDTVEDVYYGYKPSERRNPYSPLYDSSTVKYSNFRSVVNGLLKDNVGNPRDPKQPTQRKIAK